MGNIPDVPGGWARTTVFEKDAYDANVGGTAKG